MDTISTAKVLGLSEEEAKVYLALLKSGGGVASAVAKDAGVKRTTVYALLRSLAAKGFVYIYLRSGKRVYYAKNPRVVVRQFERKLEDFGKLESVAAEKKSDEKTGLRFIETVEELRAFYLDTIEEYSGKKRKEYKVISDLNAWEGLDQDFFREFRYLRGRAGIRTRLLLTPNSRDKNPEDPVLRRDVRFLPDKYRFRSSIDIFDDKVLVVGPELRSLAVVIAIPAMVDVFSSVFEMLWSYCD